MKNGIVITGTFLALAVTACEVGPDYRRPEAPDTASFKEEAPPGWKRAEPQDAAIRGPWWLVFNDPLLNSLEQSVIINNQTVRQAEAAYRQSVAIVAAAEGQLFPTLGTSGSVTRSGTTGNSNSASGLTTSQTGSSGSTIGTNNNAFSGASNTVGSSNGTTSFGRSGNQTLYNLSLNANWSLDVWGRIRRTIESDVALAKVNAADFANAALSAQTTLAADYFNLRTLDEQKRILTEAVVAYQRSLKITQNQYNAGIVAKGDVAIAEAQLETTRSQLVAVGEQRAAYEHAIAVLTGKPPAELTLPTAELAKNIPEIPLEVPSKLLERRPDIAASEEQIISANAQIGVAIAAYFPDISLSGSFGLSSGSLGTLLHAASGSWSVAGTVAETILDWGQRDAQVAEARALYDQYVAAYRQTVLIAFQQTEDQLAASRILAEQSVVQARAVAASREAERLELNQYKVGTVPYTSVVTSQQQALSNEETAATIHGNQLVSAVMLIEALGGGWKMGDLPDRGAIDAAAP